MQGAVIVVEAFRSVAGGGGEVVEGFEFPVGPTGKGVVADFCYLVNFSGTVIRVHTGSKFRDNEWNSEFLGVLVSLCHSLLMPS